MRSVNSNSSNSSLQFKVRHEADEKDEGLMQKASIQFFILAFLFIAAFSIRLYHINKPPLDFNPVRQYQQAHITRGYYYKDLSSISNDKKYIALLNMERMGFVLEPRILEHMALIGYRIAGKEALWIPRLLSSVFWLTGGFFLYLIARKVSSFGAALCSTAFYLFLPFGISASRSFQPDPLMVMMFLCSIYAILRHHDEPSSSGLFIAAIAAAIAILVKPCSLFFIFPAYIFLAILRHGILKTFIKPEFIIFGGISLLPSAIYYVHGIFYNVGFLNEQAQVSFVPSLLLKQYFWEDWLKLIGNVIGFIPLIGALIGFFIFRDKVSRALLAGLWAGYLMFGLFFTYHIHTHSYYQMLFIPVVALSLGPLGALVLKRLSEHKRAAAQVMVLIIVLVVAGAGINKAHFIDYKEKFKSLRQWIGVNPEFSDFLIKDFSREVRVAEEIGQIVGHSTNTVLLTPYYGREIAYHGELSGLPWPIDFSLQGRKERGLTIPSREELFNPHYFMIRTHGKYIKYTPDFFIITAFNEFRNQPDLENYLESNFPIMAKNDDYIIFDLRKMSGAK